MTREEINAQIEYLMAQINDLIEAADERQSSLLRATMVLLEATANQVEDEGEKSHDR